MKVKLNSVVGKIFVSVYALLVGLWLFFYFPWTGMALLLISIPVWPWFFLAWFMDFEPSWLSVIIYIISLFINGLIVYYVGAGIQRLFKLIINLRLTIKR